MALVVKVERKDDLVERQTGVERFMAKDKESFRLGKGFAISNSRIGKICIALVGVIFLYLLGYYLIFKMPRYTTLPIPSTLTYTLRGEWDITAYSDLYWGDNPKAHYYIWRRESQAYSISNDPEHGYASWEAVIQYFDRWLVEHGWMLYDDYSFDPCNKYLPESNFLPRGENGYVVYRREKTLRFASEPTVCIAVWPIDLSAARIDTYNVVLMTVTPSLYSKWYSRFNLIP